MKNQASSGAIYGMGFLGALYYFLEHAASLSEVLLGIFKAIVWPGVIVYKALGLLGV